MARRLQERGRFQKRKLKRETPLPFTKTNYYLLALGIGLVILGFIAMAEGSVEGTLPLVVAPILLVIGYCIIIPIGILYRKKQVTPAVPTQAGSQASVS
ncbi:MAG: hypothetical protein AABZ61_00500 [Bacteroidota bacterium]